jgi:hypothetical protein
MLPKLLFVFSLYLCTLTLSMYLFQESPPCTEPPPLNPTKTFHSWPRGQTVNVWINHKGFNPEEINAIKDGFKAWSDLSGAEGINSGVTFVGFANTSQPPGDTDKNIFYVYRGRPNDPTNVAATTFQGEFSNRENRWVITRASMVIQDFVTTSRSEYCPEHKATCSRPKYLESTVKHEIGHTFNLNDCYPECTGKSIMGGFSYQAVDITPCDQRAAVRHAGYSNQRGGSNGGEKPGTPDKPQCEDKDRDSYCVNEDCDDNDSTYNVSCPCTDHDGDNICEENDCDDDDYTILSDEDGDGYCHGSNKEHEKYDCNDNNSEINPGNIEEGSFPECDLCWDDKDNDCDSRVDRDDPGCRGCHD